MKQFSHLLDHGAAILVPCDKFRVFFTLTHTQSLIDSYSLSHTFILTLTETRGHSVAQLVQVLHWNFSLT
jgi:hypothetical protein